MVRLSITRLLSNLLVSGAFVLAAGAGLVAAGVSDEAARGQIVGQAGSGDVGPGGGGGG